MGWPYQFLTLSEEEKHLRREALGFYAAVAHVSALTPALIFLALRGVRIASRRIGALSGGGADDGQGDYQEVPRSPVVKARRLSSPGGLASRWRMFSWWMGDDVYLGGAHWGQRDQWVLGLGWLAWMLVLCVVGTGNDYLHLTKRFGIVAMSQMPIQYLMSCKLLNPFAWVFNSSHEVVNHYHRVMGRVIYTLLVLHILFYNYFLIMNGTWLQRVLTPAIFCGVVASFGLHAIIGTALLRVREYSYRVFFITHLMAALFIPVLIFFHASSARIYAAECVIAFIVDLISRKATAIKSTATLEAIPGTTLVKVQAAVPAAQIEAFKNRPGSHIYLSVPPGSRPPTGAGIFDYLYNPFTVSLADSESGEITFVARNRGGPLTNYLGRLASSSASNVRLDLEGPKGAVGRNIQHLTGPGVDRILLIAGGIGGAFTLPLYQAIIQDKQNPRAQFVWAIRGAGDATWAVSGSSNGKTVLDDEHIQIFVTGDMGVANDADNAAGGAVEMDSLHRNGRRGRLTADHNRKRPNIEKIVNETFRQGLEETVAVIVCGPAEMTRQVRECVRPWVMKGRGVYWHNEGFGW